MKTQGDIVNRMTGRLQSAGIPYMIVGCSIASSFHGEPRATRDVNIVIDPTDESLERFVAH